MKGCLIDFDDSFTFNVVQELEEAGMEIEVVHWQDFEVLPEADWLILGPGPGHPDEYQRIFPLIEEWIKSQKKLFGVCLGHQIYWKLLGEEVIRSKEPLHGQKVLLNLNSDWSEFLKVPEKIFVQRYNSLCVPAQGTIRNPHLKNFIQDGEILMSRGENVLTYQFHPESMGTSYRRSFFEVLLLY
jgi:anthranilate/para-aminobenzoate synthase component II